MKEGTPISTWHLHLTGQVQGIGFRPTVYRIAKQFGLAGNIKNEADGLHIVFNADKDLAFKVKRAICQDALPPLAHITNVQFKELPTQAFRDFKIIHGSDNSTPNLVLTPDVALCDTCSQELSDEEDRRNIYAFNSCSQCGPRYSIVNQLPYDRENTAMAPFEMCEACLGEYSNPTDRRYYAQAISCPNCAVRLTLYKSNTELVSTRDDEILDTVPQLWNEGRSKAPRLLSGEVMQFQDWST